ncbi:Rpn family recombination-promoting nuclease/putative transposase [Sorangium sp. So ce1099]|uniref:Rpn family recombination-promoting nuclease/putative transposase n=1 Tax=Sorangium sp. So ce1099 TaxID=3133331 RepID=UPI003F5DB02E
MFPTFATFADPKTDFVFKRIFGAEERKPLLIALLNHLLELDGPHCIRDVQHLSLEQHVAVPELRLSIVDVQCTDASGRRFVVEMQVAKVEGIEKRIVYNASKTYVMQLRSADTYPGLCDVVGVTICDFELWPDRGQGGSPEVPMLSRWRMQEQHSGALGLSQVQYVFLELPKYAAGDEPQTVVDRWAYFFREARNLDVVPPVLSEGPFRDALEVTRTAAFTPEEWEAYERAKMAEQDARGALTVARQEGHASGQISGRAAALLAFLAARGISVSSEARARIDACKSPATLDRWILRVATAASVEEVLAEPANPG